MTDQTRTAAPTTHRLEVPGGSVYFELRGSGPLLLVVGQPMTSGAFGPLADRLAADHTVVTYDPHGLGESTVEDPSLPVTPEVEADDLAAIIRASGATTADVFGTSGGAVAGLALVVRHSELVGTLIAHEPPVPDLLPDATHIRGATDEVEDRYRTGGSGAAWGGFVALVTSSGELTGPGVPPSSWTPPEPAGDAEPSGGGAPPEPTAKQRADDELFFLRMLKPFTRYLPDVDRLRSARSRIVLAVGATSGQEIARRSTEALAERLGTTVVEFPGHHGGFLDEPEPFAAAIQAALTGPPSAART